MQRRILLDKLCALGLGEKGIEELKAGQVIYWMRASVPEACSITVPKDLIAFLGCDEVVIQTRDNGDPLDWDRIGFAYNGEKAEGS